MWIVIVLLEYNVEGDWTDAVWVWGMGMSLCMIYWFCFQIMGCVLQWSK